ncbi:hypothetical protein DY000_02051806 [Brassica cretica]|uniref:Uncharacterized protein n=1 Tax=Brassica cretica TaxID=69181 RepID=A0ABQ7AL53_BRACR|nr:hypothetical protein DY000_02051806 [Brassica cretica]
MSNIMPYNTGLDSLAFNRDMRTKESERTGGSFEDSSYTAGFCLLSLGCIHMACDSRMLLGPGLSPGREFFFSMHSFLCGGFAVIVALVLLTLLPGIGLRTTLFLGVIFIVLRLVPALLAVGVTSSGIAIALASAARVHSLLPRVERSPSL